MYYFVGWLVGFNHLPHQEDLDWHDRTILRGLEPGNVYNVHAEQLRAPMGRWRSQPVDDGSNYDGNTIRVYDPLRLILTCIIIMIYDACKCAAQGSIQHCRGNEHGGLLERALDPSLPCHPRNRPEERSIHLLMEMPARQNAAPSTTPCLERSGCGRAIALRLPPGPEATCGAEATMAAPN